MTQYTKYPNQIDSSVELPISTDNVTPVKAEVVNRQREAILAIENELGISPSGTSGTVKVRLDQIDSTINELASSIENSASGLPAYTTTTASFVQPAHDGTVQIHVLNTAWMITGATVGIPEIGIYIVESIDSSTLVTLLRGAGEDEGTIVPSGILVAPTGSSGQDGTEGDDGFNAGTTTTSVFTQPAVGLSTTISVGDSSWTLDQQIVFVEGGGYYRVINRPSLTQITILNLGYPGNATPGNSLFGLVGPAGLRGATGATGSTGSTGATGATGFAAGIYGDGADGAVVINGPTTLTQDVYATTATINGVVYPAGYRIFASTSITTGVTCEINVSGSSGLSDGTGGTAGPGGSNGASGSTFGNGTSQGASAYLGGIGGNGGAGSGGPGGDADSGSALSRPPRDLVSAVPLSYNQIINAPVTLPLAIPAAVTQVRVGGGGASGGSGDGSHVSAGAGGGGGIFLMASPIIIHNGVIKANGGDAGAAAGTNTGGSGGGAGGLIYYITHSYSGSGTFNVSGGSGGSKTGTGVTGSAGGTGYSILISV